jgi:hypothetical protein
MRSLPALVVGPLLFCACEVSETDMVRANAAIQFHCTESSVSVRQTHVLDPEQTLYEASTDEQYAIYRCKKTYTDLHVGSRVAGQSPRLVTVCELDRGP